VLSQAHLLKERMEMVDAAYLRRQAELCFAMAELLSNPEDAKCARLAAERFVQRAKTQNKNRPLADHPSEGALELGNS
jgi:hypothetical protein